MAQIVDDICQGKLTSITGEKFTDVLAIGIGGSYILHRSIFNNKQQANTVING